MVTPTPIINRFVLAAALFGLAASSAGQSQLAGAATAGVPLVGDSLEPTVEVAAAAVGRKMFFDAELSADGRISCATCHQPDRAFTDGKAVAEGVGGRKGARNSPSLLNAALGQSFFWDGRRQALEEQVLDPLFNPSEHGLTGEDDLVTRVQRDPSYRPLLRQAFGIALEQIRSHHVSLALAAYVRTLRAGDSPVDRYLFAHDHSALEASEQRGLALFRGRAQCATCHTIGERDALFTDHDYHSLSVGFAAAKVAPLTRQLAGTDLRERHRLIISDPDIAALGRFAVTLEPKDVGKFKTPTLRNVSLTAPYMHDGSIPTLEAAVEREIYYRGRARGRPLILTPAERSDLVAFLKALTSPTVTAP